MRAETGIRHENGEARIASLNEYTVDSMAGVRGVRGRRSISRGPLASGVGFFCLTVGMLSICLASRSVAQTPSPLQEWQYVNAVPLMKLFQPDIPETQLVLGAGGEDRPLYDGAQNYRFVGGPTFDVRYRDIAFFSTGEGLGVNVVRGQNVTAGVAIGYDFGRKTSDDENNLRGFPNIGRAPVVKLFANYVVSKEFPLVIRLDMRQSVGRGPDGAVGDLSAYFPLPGSSQKLIMLLGPSVTWGSEKYLQLRFGVTPEESEVSMHPVFHPTAGVSASGLGYSATYFVTAHWMLELDAACHWLLNSAQDSPITERVSAPAAAFSVSYRW
jgi:outer membrane scaffolding protein for murein synthesis (MipA/OmpV family)